MGPDFVGGKKTLYVARWHPQSAEEPGPFLDPALPALVAPTSVAPPRERELIGSGVRCCLYSLLFSIWWWLKVACFQNMDPSQLALIKQLIADAEAKQTHESKPRDAEPGSVAKTETDEMSSDPTTSGANGVGDVATCEHTTGRDAAAEPTATPSTTSPVEPVGPSNAADSAHGPAAKSKVATTLAPAPIATPCRSNLIAPAVLDGAAEELPVSEPTAKLKEFWSKFKTPRSAPHLPSESAASTPGGTPALPAPAPPNSDEPMPPATPPTTAPAPMDADEFQAQIKAAAKHHYETKFMKMDADEFQAQIKAAAKHHYFPEYFAQATKGADDVEDMVNWMTWLESKLQAENQKLLHKPTLILGYSDPNVDLVDAHARPTARKGPASEEKPAQHTLPPVPTTIVDDVQAALLRATTMDLEQQRAPPAPAEPEPRPPHTTAAKDESQAKEEQAKQEEPSGSAPENKEAEATAAAAEAKAAAQRKVRAIKGKFHRSIRSS